MFRKSGGRPPWVKTYTKQLGDFDYCQLTPAERGWLHDLRLLAAMVDNKIPNDSAWLRARLGIPASTRRPPPIEKLTRLGFLQPWSLRDDLVTDSSRTGHVVVTSRDETGTDLVTANADDSAEPSENGSGKLSNESRTALDLEGEEEREKASSVRLPAVASNGSESGRARFYLGRKINGEWNLTYRAFHDEDEAREAERKYAEQYGAANVAVRPA